MALPLERPRNAKFIHRDQYEGGFELKELTFSYPNENLVALSDLTLSIGAGERVAILGRVGSGKSTLLKLMLKLYEPTGGNILVDGIDLRQHDPAELRRQIGYVSQDIRLFYGTLRDNIILGVEFAEDWEVLQAARMAGLGPLISRHGSGLDLLIMEGGIGLSGGQRAAVGLARALIRKPRMFLFDEPTASMDHTMEQAFIARMRPLLEERTLVLVTHKPTLLVLVDRIIVLEDGKVLADGPRDSIVKALMSQEGNADLGGPGQ
jgi:ATP-binding cassette subfamily C protein LapB